MGGGGRGGGAGNYKDTYSNMSLVKLLQDLDSIAGG